MIESKSERQIVGETLFAQRRHIAKDNMTEMIDHSLAMNFNNLGVALLDQGNRQVAICLFKGASQLVTYSLSQEMNCTNYIEEALNDPRVMNAYIFYQMYANLDDASELTSLSTMNVCDDTLLNASSPFIFKQAIVLSKDQLPSEWTHRVSLCCSILVYNIALVYHLNAADSVLESCGHRALRLYEMAFSLISPPGECSITTLVGGRLAMYCLNNMAALNHDLTEWDMSAECMRRLSAIATYLQSTRGLGASLSAECQSFLLNAMVLKPPTWAPAA